MKEAITASACCTMSRPPSRRSRCRRSCHASASAMPCSARCSTVPKRRRCSTDQACELVDRTTATSSGTVVCSQASGRAPQLVYTVEGEHQSRPTRPISSEPRRRQADGSATTGVVSRLRKVILAYAGRRAQSLVGDPELVGKRIRRLLVGLRPSAVVGAAADGGDLLPLEAALEIPDGPAVHIVLPTARDVFRGDSVDPGWRDRFDRVLGEVERRGGSAESLDLEAGEAAYRRGNQAFLDRAAALAADAERSVVVVVAREGEGAMVTDLIERARVSGVPALRIDPSVHIPSRPRCF